MNFVSTIARLILSAMKRRAIAVIVKVSAASRDIHNVVDSGRRSDAQGATANGDTVFAVIVKQPTAQGNSLPDSSSVYVRGVGIL